MKKSILVFSFLFVGLAAQAGGIPVQTSAPVVVACPSGLIVSFGIPSANSVPLAVLSSWESHSPTTGENTALSCNYTVAEDVKAPAIANGGEGGPVHYTCPATLPMGEVVGAASGPTGCSPGDWCQGPANGYSGLSYKSGPTLVGTSTSGFRYVCFYDKGSVELGTSAMVGRHCDSGTAGNESADGRFLCW